MFYKYTALVIFHTFFCSRISYVRYSLCYVLVRPFIFIIAALYSCNQYVLPSDLYNVGFPFLTTFLFFAVSAGPFYLRHGRGPWAVFGRVSVEPSRGSATDIGVGFVRLPLPPQCRKD